MADSLSPLAQSNLAALRALSAAMTEGIAAFTGDMADPENQNETSLTGDEILGFLQCIMQVCGLWSRMAENIVIAQPEFIEWETARDLAGDLKPGLND